MSEQVKAELLRLEKEHDGLTPDIVIEAAKDQQSPLHGSFNWDADWNVLQHLRTQARELIGKYRVEFIPSTAGPTTIRGMVSVMKPPPAATPDLKPTRVYVSTETALKTPDLRDQLLAQLDKDIKTLTAKYGHLSEFSERLYAAAQAAEAEEQTAV